ncbi:GNAT family N-acetyltransferase [Amycolatopsis sp. NPDC051903]|uniref:GNAT family N-acetyltransferase n=1 Tax=Amycolatopsis sp. NPDC051903 TaxID=3363936 RepID=UPI0037A89D0C
MRFELRAVEGEHEYPRLLAVWRSSVEATHDFLTPADIEFFAARVPAYFPGVDLTAAVVDGVVAGFSGVAGGELAMLFVHAAHRGEGIGSALLRKAFAEFPRLTVDVNEQNAQAVGFYLHHGFVVVGRSELDSEGRPFPLLHLKRA